MYMHVYDVVNQQPLAGERMTASVAVRCGCYQAECRRMGLLQVVFEIAFLLVSGLGTLAIFGKRAINNE
jgi:hypothetical protein